MSLFLEIFLFALVGLTSAGSIDPKYAKNITLYHVNEANYTGIANMDTGNPAGDAFFSLRSVYLPIECAKTNSHRFHGDCDNPEVVGSKLTVTEVTVEVDSRYGNYSECNVCTNSTVPFTRDQKCVDGDYVCVCGDFRNLTTNCPPTVGVEDPAVVFSQMKPIPFLSPNYEWWLHNLVDRMSDGLWYSTPASGECDDTTKPCYWRLVENKRRVLKSCQDAYIFAEVSKQNKPCYSACPQPTNTSSTCYIDCFFSTLLGPKSGKVDSTAGWTQQQIVDMWTFPIANDQTKGGCPEYKP